FDFNFLNIFAFDVGGGCHAGGIIKSRHSHESGNLELRTGETFLPDKFPCRQTWIPACAGMTNFFGHVP
ncbi:TPA: hypothetical protein ACYBJV_002156, partial [Neisseria meningitidis]